MNTIKDIKQRLESPFHKEMLRRNYQSLLDRTDVSGFVLESLTGAYEGMYPRTIGGLARLFVEVGQAERLEASLDYCIRSMKDNDLEYLPHVLGKRRGKQKVPVLCDLVQPDGDAHFILAWALLAKKRGVTDFEKKTYPKVAALLNRITSGPLLSRATRWRVEPGLVLNTHLEHSREQQYWHAFDFLTQSFVASALQHMVPLAKKLSKTGQAGIWQERLKFLEKQINTNMVRTFEGKRIYSEMLLPTGRKPEVFEGLGWLNLAPIPAGWKGFDTGVFRNTIDKWHEKAEIKWKGPVICAADWAPSGHSNETYGKILGWDMLGCLKFKEYDRLCAILDFLERVNTLPLYGEKFQYNTVQRNWEIVDAGNGEQTAWMCFSIVSLRKSVGLPSLP
ncbi:MAG: hypothetical protein A2231_08405 [Candidatus Firestonebacteria bacterium RIFOXYA2_FULL_40_8]|nr:MAG: hypothetical protein A2231_08405 [Candidatus Firestonebacteria bacterium RIFOXYA2_FULL_40_8]